MNAKQSAKAAAKRIGELEHQIMLNIRDIRLYVQTIHSMINHGSPCEFCEDRDECEIAGKNIDAGCDDWMLKLWKPGEEVKDWQRMVMAGKQTELFAEGVVPNDSQTVFPESQVGGEGHSPSGTDD